MNRQGRLITKDGIQTVQGGINWTKTRHLDSSETRGYTCNPVGGCRHECSWRMPTGDVAKCYAETTAEGVAQAAYPDGFGTHYWNPKRLDEPGRVSQPAKIFIDSMSDLFGHWVPEDHIRQVLTMMTRNENKKHTFLCLTKNPKRYKNFTLPNNMWAGFSTPPDFMNGRELSPAKRIAKLTADLSAIKVLKYVQPHLTIWCSVEPLSWNVAPYFIDCRLDWVVIGPASNGRAIYQPDSQHLTGLVDVLDRQETPVFYKQELACTEGERREEFPGE